MTARTAILVSHGQPSDPQVAEDEIRALSHAVAEHAPGWTIRGATLAADGALDATLQEAAPGTLIYPMFMADGWFTQTVLPKRLGDARVHQLPPFGMDPALPDFAATWLTGEMDKAGYRAEDTSLFIAAHGSGRSPRPAEVTQEFAAALARRLSLRRIGCGFVEQAPFLADACAGLAPPAICLPFFAARRGHVLEDLPDALDASGFSGLRLGPIGCQPGIPAFIAGRLNQERLR